MKILIADKYAAWSQECDNRINTFNANDNTETMDCPRRYSFIKIKCADHNLSPLAREMETDSVVKEYLTSQGGIVHEPNRSQKILGAAV